MRIQLPEPLLLSPFLSGFPRNSLGCKLQVAVATKKSTFSLPKEMARRLGGGSDQRWNPISQGGRDWQKSMEDSQNFLKFSSAHTVGYSRFTGSLLEPDFPGLRELGYGGPRRAPAKEVRLAESARSVV